MRLSSNFYSQHHPVKSDFFNFNFSDEWPQVILDEQWNFQGCLATRCWKKAFILPKSFEDVLSRVTCIFHPISKGSVFKAVTVSSGLRKESTALRTSLLLKPGLRFNTLTFAQVVWEYFLWANTEMDTCSICVSEPQ